jgi:hypothetical protein
MGMLPTRDFTGLSENMPCPPQIASRISFHQNALYHHKSIMIKGLGIAAGNLERNAYPVWDGSFFTDCQFQKIQDKAEII